MNLQRLINHELMTTNLNISGLFSDKSLKPKEKTEALGQWLLTGKTGTAELIAFAETAKDPVKATCIEALEYATRQDPELADPDTFHFVITCLRSKAPRVKWESARVIGNSVHLYKSIPEPAIRNLLDNAAHEGTVVRWSAAFALAEILKLNTAINQELIPAIEAMMGREEKNSIRKIYGDALRKIRK